MNVIPVAQQTMGVVVINDQLTLASGCHDFVANGLHFFRRRRRVQGAVKDQQGDANAPGLLQG